MVKKCTDSIGIRCLLFILLYPLSCPTLCLLCPSLPFHLSFLVLSLSLSVSLSLPISTFFFSFPFSFFLRCSSHYPPFSFPSQFFPLSFLLPSFLFPEPFLIPFSLLFLRIFCSVSFRCLRKRRHQERKQPANLNQTSSKNLQKNYEKYIKNRPQNH